MNIFNKHSLFYTLCFLIIFNFIFNQNLHNNIHISSSLNYQNLLIGIFIITIFSFNSYLKIASKKGWGQYVREEGLETHLKKRGTPTAAGWIFFVMLIIPLYIFLPNFLIEDSIIWVPILAITIMFITGLIDDLYKINGKKEGLLARYRLLAQFLVGSLLGYYFLPWDLYTNLAVGFLLFGAAVNGVNFTDGSDGLLAAVVLATPIGLLILYIVSQIMGVGFPIVGSKFIFILLGLLMLSWIPFNRHPAKLFMGETGSYTIGAIVGFIAIYSLKNEPIITFLLLAVPVFQITTVVIQVFFYKKFGKRVFLMAPFHHHLEKKGWSENKIAYSAFFCQLFLTISLIGSVTY